MKTQVLRATLLVAVGLVLALAVNAFHPQGIPLVRPTSEEIARHQGITPVHLDTAKLLMKDPAVLFVDARPANVYRRGRIPGAVSFPDFEFSERIAAFKDSVPLDRPLVVYCDGIECGASKVLADSLSASGFTYIHLFFGGWVEWRDAGERIEK